MPECALPCAALFEHLRDAVDRIDGYDEQGRRAERAAADAEDLTSADAVELDTKARDVAARADLFFLDNDRGDDAVEHRIAERGTVAAVQFAIELRPALALRVAPALGARIIGIVAGDVDEDTAGEEIAAAVDRRDAAIAARDLAVDDAREQNSEEQADKRGPAPVTGRQRAWE